MATPIERLVTSNPVFRDRRGLTLPTTGLVAGGGPVGLTLGLEWSSHGGVALRGGRMQRHDHQTPKMELTDTNGFPASLVIYSKKADAIRYRFLRASMPDCSNSHKRQPVNVLEIPHISGDQLGVGKKSSCGYAAVERFQTGV